mmetsp:Transcript_24273/g.43890  ORF Transcript_24273/g.43890 Transcript_24273/m.43890 type:complete len:159 (+) Transcript_24273:2019-2495(+)
MCRRRCRTQEVLAALLWWAVTCSSFIAISPKRNSAFMVAGIQRRDATRLGSLGNTIFPSLVVSSEEKAAGREYRGQMLVALCMESHHKNSDDDDISQHDFMDDISPPNITKSTTGYRRAEDWHEEHIAQNPEEYKILAHLKRDKANWAMKFKSFNPDI